MRFRLAFSGEIRRWVRMLLWRSCGLWLRLRSRPQGAKGLGEHLRFHAVRRIEVVPVWELFECEVGERPPETLSDLAVLVRVAQPTQGEVHGPVRPSQH